MFPEENTTLVSVCIATYKRNELLRKLLLSLANQKLDKNIKIEVVVTDNDPIGGAKAVINSIKDSFFHPIRYSIQPQKNISLTRNRCISNSQGTLLCFIDDDEIADKYWINNLYYCLYKFNADGVFGYVEPVFDVKIPDKFKQREFYFSTVGKTGSIAQHYYTTNCIIKSELVNNDNSPFDPDYGLTGGEDVHLFEKLVIKGAKFITSKEAITYEFIPQSRGNYKYLFKRALRGGQSYLRRTLERRNSLSFKVTSILKILLRFFYGLFLLSISPFFINKSVLAIISWGDAIGKLRALLFKYREIH